MNKQSQPNAVEKLVIDTMYTLCIVYKCTIEEITHVGKNNFIRIIYKNLNVSDDDAYTLEICISKKLADLDMREEIFKKYFGEDCFQVKEIEWRT